jgi:2-haloacid dehalogenase
VRWVTFDCYGTLIDWDGGVGRELARLFGAERAPDLLAGYHAAEAEVEAAEYRRYAEVMALSLARAARAAGVAVPAGEEGALGRALPGWRPFPEVPAELLRLRRHGWRLAVLSNCDREHIAASARALGVAFDEVVVAQDVRSYKPATAHWERFFAITGAERDRHVHVAASPFHDIAPARELGLTSVWINRAGAAPVPGPARVLPDLRGLADALEPLRRGRRDDS